MKKTILTLLCLALLTACDNQTIEQIHADRIAACQEMIRTTKPMPTEHLPLTERSKEIEFNGEWENCRAKVEDWSFLDGEKERLPEFDTKKYVAFKLGGNFYIMPKKYVGTLSLAVPHTWQHDYPAGEGRAESDPIKKGQQGGVTFFIDASSSAAYRRINSHMKGVLDFTEVCEKTKIDRDKIGGFIWHDLLFSMSLISKRQLENEWDTICPNAVKIVSEFQEIELKPKAVN